MELTEQFIYTKLQRFARLFSREKASAELHFNVCKTVESFGYEEYGAPPGAARYLSGEVGSGIGGRANIRL